MIPDLLKEFEGYSEYTILNYSLEPDGYGGMIPTWTQGASFYATITLDDSVQMKIAEASGVKGIYRVVTQKSVRLPWHTVFRDAQTGKTYRVTSKDENAVPSRSTLDIRYVSAEDYEISDSGDDYG